MKHFCLVLHRNRPIRSVSRVRESINSSSCRVYRIRRCLCHCWWLRRDLRFFLFFHKSCFAHPTRYIFSTRSITFRSTPRRNTLQKHGPNKTNLLPRMYNVPGRVALLNRSFWFKRSPTWKKDHLVNTKPWTIRHDSCYKTSAISVCILDVEHSQFMQIANHSESVDTLSSLPHERDKDRSWSWSCVHSARKPRVPMMSRRYSKQ